MDDGQVHRFKSRALTVALPHRAATNCLDWDALSAVDLQRRWSDLTDWVSETLVRQMQYQIPWCWPHHASIVDELRALWCWHQELMAKQEGGAEELLRFHETLRRLVIDWPKPCSKQDTDVSRDIRARLLETEIGQTQRLFKEVMQREYLARTRRRP